MLLEIWFPQIVIAIGTIGALFSFVMVFMPSEKNTSEESEHDSHH